MEAELKRTKIKIQLTLFLFKPSPVVRDELEQIKKSFSPPFGR